MNTHAPNQSLLPLEESPSDGRIFLNASVWFVDSDGYRVVFRWHDSIYTVALSDEATIRRTLKRLGLARKPASLPRMLPQIEEQAPVIATAETTRPTMRGFKIAHAELRRQLHRAEAQVEQLLPKRKAIPARIPASDRKTLNTEKKLIADTIKMAAYQVETQLLGMLQDHYARADQEGRTLLHAAFQSPGRVEVTRDELRVTIAAERLGQSRNRSGTSFQTYGRLA